MFVSEETLDDLLHVVFQKILAEGTKVTSSKGKNTELSGVLLELKNPFARLSRTEVRSTTFSCLGETLWYLAGSSELSFIEYYLPEYRLSAEKNGKVWGAYGPRLFQMRRTVNQIDSVIALLNKKPQTRQAVIQIFDAEDILEVRQDIPCTCTLQFIMREKILHLVAHMRSNDAYKGLPHDVFAFTFLQEIIARTIGAEIGTYKHFAASLHIYDSNLNDAEKYLSEKWQEKIEMPPMPAETPWPHIEKLVAAEKSIREGQTVDPSKMDLPNYWQDLIRLLMIFAATKSRKDATALKAQMYSKVFDIHIDKRIASVQGN